MRYETEYVIVAGIAWLRRTRVETSDGRVEDSVWAVTFEGDTIARKGPADGSTSARGHIGDFDWELTWTALAAPFETPNRALRRIAPSHLVTTPAVLVDGHVGERRLEQEPGHAARLWGKRHARSWGWAHASTADGRWAHLLTASAPPLPRVSQHATQAGGPGLPVARGSVDGTRITVGKYAVDAPPESFVGLRYLDTDGSHLWCYHSERGRLRGPGADFDGAAMEIAVREPIEGWTVAA